MLENAHVHGVNKRLMLAGSLFAAFRCADSFPVDAEAAESVRNCANSCLSGRFRVKVGVFYGLE